MLFSMTKVRVGKISLINSLLFPMTQNRLTVTAALLLYILQLQRCLHVHLTTLICCCAVLHSLFFPVIVRDRTYTVIREHAFAKHRPLRVVVHTLLLFGQKKLPTYNVYDGFNNGP